MKNKVKIETKEKEKEMLKLTIDLLVTDNTNLKNSLGEMETTVKAHKFQLQEYLSKITDRDTAVQNLNTTIDQLHQNLNKLSLSQNKAKLHNVNNTNYNDNNSSSTMEIIKSPEMQYVQMPLTQREKTHQLEQCSPFIQRRIYDIDKYKDYCNKQNQLLEEITNLKHELNNLSLRNKFKDINIELIERKTLNLKDTFSEKDLSKITQSLKDNNKCQMYLVDNKKHLWQIVRRKDLNEKNILHPAIIDSQIDIRKIENENKSIVNIKEFWPQKQIKQEYRIKNKDIIDKNGESNIIITSVKDMMNDPYFI